MEGFDLSTFRTEEATASPTLIYLVPTLHWDREWFLPFEVMRTRLVTLLDHIVSYIQEESRFSLLLDSTLIVRDYLEIKPEQTGVIKKLISQGRLIVSPWFVQTDQFLSGDELLVRNLVYGWKDIRQWGQETSILYCPDSCGCISQLPQICSLVRAEAIITQRGIDETKTELRWRGSDGTEVLLCCVPDGYDAANTLRMETTEKRKTVIDRAHQLRSRSVDGVLMLSNVSSRLDAFVHCVSEFGNELGPSFRTCIGKLGVFLTRVGGYIQHLPMVKGELRSNKRSTLHPRVASVRVSQKLLQYKCESLYRNWAEPFDALSSALGKESLDCVVNRGWNLLLMNASEDSIRGCHVDEVAADVRIRHRWILDLGCSIKDQSLRYFCKNINSKELVLQFIGSEAMVRPLMVFNAVGWKRGGFATAQVVMPRHWELLMRTRGMKLQIRCGNGSPVPLMVSDVTRVENPDLEPLRRPSYEVGTRYDLTFPAGDVPAYGYRTFLLCLVPVEKHQYGVKDGDFLVDSCGRSSINAGPTFIENQFLRIEARPNGSLEIKDKLTGNRFTRCCMFEDLGDAGDLYSFSPPLRQNLVSSASGTSHISLQENNDLQATLRVRLFLDVPVGLSDDLIRRSEVTKPVNITIDVTIREGERFACVNLTVDNCVCDHLLRVTFATDIDNPRVQVGQPFFVGTRQDEGDVWGADGNEYYPCAFPTNGVVSFSEEGRGLAILTGGLREYEIRKEGIVSITLIRGVGRLARSGLALRRKRLAPAEFTLESAQERGQHSFSLRVLPHDGNLKTSKLARDVQEEAVQLEGHLSDWVEGSLPPTWSFIEVRSEELVITSVKRSEDKTGIVVRMYNASRQPVESEIYLSVPIRKAVAVDLLEQPTGKIEQPDASTVIVEFTPLSIKTLLFYLDADQEKIPC